MRTLVAGARICAAAVLGFATPAFAQEGENDSVSSPEPAAAGVSEPAQGSAPPAASQPPPQPPGAQPPPPYWTPLGAPPPGWPPPGADRVEPPTENKPARPGRPPHVHDGFYFRLGLGVGLLRTASSFEGTVGALPADRAIGELTYSGLGLAVDGGIGGSPMPGLAIGYGFAWQIADDPTLTIENTPSSDGESERTDPLGATIHGVLVDVFPNPEGNLELGGLIGLATVGTGDRDNPSQGIAAAVWGGYGVWAGSQLSLIALLRLSLARTTSEYTNSPTQFGPVPQGGGSTTQLDRADTTFTVGVITGLLVH